jgi:kinesin family protein 5
VEFDKSNKTEIKIVNEESNKMFKHKFNFDYVFDMDSSQDAVYQIAGKPVIESVLEGFNGTILAYGQTSSGKTYTMQGIINDEKSMGIIPRMVKTLFDTINDSSDKMEFTIKISMVEIYMERIRDLFDPLKDKLKIIEDKQKGVCIEDCSESTVISEEEVFRLMAVGNENRAIGVTDMNAQSSRSHSIFIMTIIMQDNEDFSCKIGKLYLVDLAGSERISKTNAKDQTLNEAKMINKSLSTLGRVITSLTDGKSPHIPYRDSKLTRLLQDSLGGNSKTSLIVTASPSLINSEETLSTCRFGMTAKTIKNNAKINKEFTVAELKLLLEKMEIEVAKKNQLIAFYLKLLNGNNIEIPVTDLTTVPYKKTQHEEENVEGEEEALPNLKTDKVDANMKKEKMKNIELTKENETNQTNIETAIDKLSAERDKNAALLNKIAVLLNEVKSKSANIAEINSLHEKALSVKTYEIEELKMQHKKELDSIAINNEKEIQRLTKLLDDRLKLISQLEFDCAKVTEEKEKEMQLIAQKQERIEKQLEDIKSDQTNQIANSNNPFNSSKDLCSPNITNSILSPQKVEPTEVQLIKESISCQTETTLIDESYGIDDKEYELPSEENKIQELLPIKNEQITTQEIPIEPNCIEENTAIASERRYTIINSIAFLVVKPITDLTKEISVFKGKTEKEMKEKEDRFVNEKIQILNSLKAEQVKGYNLEKDLLTANQHIKSMQNLMNEDESSVKKKAIDLEKSLEILTALYHQLATKTSTLSTEKDIINKMLSKKIEMIEDNEKKIMTLKKQIVELKDKLHQSGALTTSEILAVNRNVQVKKTIVGGRRTSNLSTPLLLQSMQLTHGMVSNFNAVDKIEEEKNDSDR